jgi:hypothetical protein
MSQVVQARCPHCKNLLRIPAEWVHQPMRCKHCGQIFQAVPRPPAPQVAPAPAVPVKVVPPVPVKVVAPATGKFTPPAGSTRPAPRPVPIAVGVAPPPPKSGSPFAFDEPSAPVVTPRRPRRGSWWKPLAVIVGVLGLGAVIAALFGPQLADMFNATAQPKSKAVSSSDTRPFSKDDGANERPLEIVTGTDKLPQPPKRDGRPKKDKDGAELPPPIPPKTDNTRPKDDSTRPKTDDSKPKADDSKPKTDTGKAKTDTGKPNVDRGKPKADGSKPKADSGRPPKTDGTKVVKVPPKRPRDEPFPRRALFISVNDYLFANPLHFGNQPFRNFPGASTSAVRTLFGNLPLRFPNTQLLHLSDGGIEPHSPLKPVIERTLADFVNTSRAQDRVVVLFAGHVVEIENEAYLVPIEGDLADPRTLLPLSWVYDRLRECRARQKVLILDVCRFNPTSGQERPGGGPMGKVLDARLQQPPPGVQVWSSCGSGQQAYELETGSVFLQALCAAQMELRKTDTEEPGSSIPVERLVSLVNAHMARVLAPHKLQQASRLTGKEPDTGTPPNPEEPPALVVSIQPPPILGNAASADQVQSILDEMNQIPPVRAGRNDVVESRLEAAKLPPFPARELDKYGPGDKGKEPDKSPFREAIKNAMKVLKENATRFRMRETFTGANSAQVKGQIKNEQSAPGKAKLYLKEALEDLRAVAKKRDAEPSKRWQAQYDYVLARLLARLIYVSEYNYALAQIRTDSLPDLPEGMTAYKLRLGSRAKVSVPESETKGWVRELKQLWEKLVNEYPDTPWAVIARRERMTALGLEWRPARE